MIKKSPSYLTKFIELPGTEKLILVRGLLLSFMFYAIVRFLPLRYYIRLLKSRSISNPTELSMEYDHKIIAKNISRLEKMVPWSMTCLNKVLTARYLYKNLGIDSSIQLSLFVDHSGKKCAHASLLVNGTLEYLQLGNSNLAKIYL